MKLAELIHNMSKLNIELSDFEQKFGVKSPEFYQAITAGYECVRQKMYVGVQRFSFNLLSQTYYVDMPKLIKFGQNPKSLPIFLFSTHPDDKVSGKYQRLYPVDFYLNIFQTKGLLGYNLAAHNMIKHLQRFLRSLI